MRSRFRPVAVLLLPATALFACVLTAQGNTIAPAHSFADAATVVPVPSPNPGDGFSWG